MLLIVDKFTCVSVLKFLSYFIIQKHYFNRQSRDTPIGSRKLNFDKHERNFLL